MISKKYLPIFYFLLGFGFFMFTRLSKLVPSIDMAILIAPILILRFIRTQPAGRGIWLTLLGFILSMNIALWGLFEFDETWMTILFGLIRSTAMALIWFLPFMLDRILYKKFSRWGTWSTLIFPIVTTAIFFLSSLEGPFDDGSGTISSFGFGYGSNAFIQVRSIFGIWILVFIHSWLFSVINYFWENQLRWANIRKLAIAYPSVIVSFFLLGWLKTSSLLNPEKETVHIAAVVLIPENGEAVPMSRIFETKATSPYGETLKRIEGLTKKAVEAGARIVSFQEYAMVIHREDEIRLREDYQRIARQNNTYLSITYACFSENDKGENKHIFINGKGEILLDYTKRYLLGLGPFGESGVFKKGPEIIQSVETPYGKIGISICRDMSFPSYQRQASKAHVDIMLSPSYDWPKSPSPWYLPATIENGFSFVRPTYNGYSYAADYHGNVLAHMDSDLTAEGIMYADVPVRGIRVLYPLVGDLMGWLSVVATFIILGLTFFKRNEDVSHGVDG
jgi:apolipoprotein N-acyltransferase